MGAEGHISNAAFWHKEYGVFNWAFSRGHVPQDDATVVDVTRGG